MGNRVLHIPRHLVQFFKNNIDTLRNTLMMNKIHPLTSNSLVKTSDLACLQFGFCLLLCFSLFSFHVQPKRNWPIYFPNVLFIFRLTLVLNSSSASEYYFTLSLPHLFKSYFLYTCHPLSIFVLCFSFRLTLFLEPLLTQQYYSNNFSPRLTT